MAVTVQTLKARMANYLSSGAIMRQSDLGSIRTASAEA